MKRYRLIMLMGAMVILPFAAFAASANSSNETSRDAHYRQSPFVQMIRQETARFKDAQVAVAEGYTETSCVSGPNGGAMGIHYVNFALIGDGAVDPIHPEVLLYEPLPDGSMRLVGVEFLTFSEIWEAFNDLPPVLKGQLFYYTGSPNRSRVPAHYSLHVWGWKKIPLVLLQIGIPAFPVTPTIPSKSTAFTDICSPIEVLNL